MRGSITFVEPHEGVRRWVYADNQATLRLVAMSLERAAQFVNGRHSVEQLELFFEGKQLERDAHGRWM